MLWSKALIIIVIEIALGFLCGRVGIPYFRKLKTGKLEMYVGDRFQKDGSEPKFGGVVIAVPLAAGALLSIGALDRGMSNGSLNSGGKIIAVVIASLLFMAVGVVDDWLKDVRKSNLGLRVRTKLLLEFTVSLGFLLWLNLFWKDKSTAVLLPFRMGYMDFNILYYPLVAIGMTVTVNAVKLHDCFGSDTQSGIDGLCAVTILIFSLAITVCGNIIEQDFVSASGCVCAAAIIGFLVWGLAPGKIYLGESGALLLGGLVSSMTVASKLHFLVFMLGIGFFIDSFCTLIQYNVFIHRKKLVFKGNSLHSHLKSKGYSDYKIILIFTCINVIGAIAGVAFALYSTKL